MATANAAHVDRAGQLEAVRAKLALQPPAVQVSVAMFACQLMRALRAAPVIAPLAMALAMAEFMAGPAEPADGASHG